MPENYDESVDVAPSSLNTSIPAFDESTPNTRTSSESEGRGHSFAMTTEQVRRAWKRADADCNRLARALEASMAQSQYGKIK